MYCSNAPNWLRSHSEESAALKPRNFASKRQARADGKDRRRDSEQLVGVLAHEFQHLPLLRLRSQQFDLVDHDNDLFAPVPDLLQEGALRFAEWPVRAGDEEDKVAAGHEVFGQLLVVADDSIRAGRVDQIDLLQPGNGQAAHRHPTIRARLLGRIAMADQDQFAGGRHHAFGQIVAPQQRVDHRALAGIELAHHHHQEKLLQLGQRIADQPQVGVGRIQARQRHLQVAQQAALIP